MKSVLVFDPPMCCATGVCGPGVDPQLIRFARDLQWLSEHGIRVERFNLAQQPHAFASADKVTKMLAVEGNECLPVILVDGQVVSRAVYPSRQQLAQATGLADQLQAETNVSLPVIQG